MQSRHINLVQESLSITFAVLVGLVRFMSLDLILTDIRYIDDVLQLTDRLTFDVLIVTVLMIFIGRRLMGGTGKLHLRRVILESVLN